MSNINPQNIDGTYPIAGQDNNSQGFRDNFTNTVNNFTFAAAELTDLQNNALLKAPLGSVGQSGTPTNNMNYAYLTAPQLIQTVETINNLGTITNGGNVTVDWTTGHYQTVSLAGSATLAFASTWPGSATNPLYTELIVQANVQVGGSGLTLPSSVVNNLSDIAGASGQTITFPTAGLYQYKFSTSDGGATITIRDLINNYQTGAFNTITPSTGLLSITGNLKVGPTVSPVTFGNVVVNGISNANSFVQLNIQNINSVGTLVSADFIATAPNGTDSTNFIDLGINGNNFSSSAWTISGANDGYLYVDGGNLTLGTDTLGKTVSIHVGGLLSTNIVANFNAGGTSIIGNLYTGGARVTGGYQLSQAAANVNITIGTTVERLIITPTNVITTIPFGAVVTLPGSNVDGTTVSISANASTVIQPVASPGTTLSPSGNVTLSAGGVTTFFYHASETKWYKIA